MGNPRAQIDRIIFEVFPNDRSSPSEAPTLRANVAALRVAACDRGRLHTIA